MFKISWDRETGGIKLNSLHTKETLTVSPRPVFFEELDLLKLDDLGWHYPRCIEPLLWACNKHYYYRGEFVFEVKGASIYDDPSIIFQKNCEKLKLVPIDVNAMLEQSKDEMFLIESEAIEFIRGIYVQYSTARDTVKNLKANQFDFEALVTKLEKQTKKKMVIVKQDCESFDIMTNVKAKQEGKITYQTTRIDKFLASFSGGKDSQVVLDLCTRSIPPWAYEVVYSDTGYELPTSLSLFEEVRINYNKLYPELKFSISKNHEEVLNYWDKIGTPSDTHRWCCSIMKTAPLYRKLKVDGSNRQAKVLTFDGVRAEESTKRSGYDRIGKGVKHNTVINASPILNWTTTEVFLYLFKYKLPINQSYRQGMTRVGCLICPFSSEWNDMISNKFYNSQLRPFLTRIENLTEKTGIIDVKDYIKSGNWKRRAGGRGINFPSFLEIISVKPDLQIKCNAPQKNLLTWLAAVGEFSIHGEDGELRYDREIFKFSISITNNEHTIVFKNTAKSPSLQGLLKRALYKATYCINCEACEVECPTGALSILPDAAIDIKKCTHCHKCLIFHDYGCIVATSLNITGRNNNNNMKLISYNNFGLREEWVDAFLSSHETYFSDNTHGLNVKEQLPNFVKWLVQAEVLFDSKERQITPLGQILSRIYRNMPDFVWEVIWINLSYNSPIAKWYKESVEWNCRFTQADIQELVKNDYPTDSLTTIKNIVYALFRTFKESPIGEMGMLKEKDKLHYQKIPFEEVSREAIAYSLYKYSEARGLKSFRVADLYLPANKQGIFREVGISKSMLEKNLRSLNSDTNRILIAELNMGLDHIALRNDLSSLEILSILSTKA